MQNKLWQEAADKINNLSDLNELEKIRIEYLGKNGVITNSLKDLSSLSVEEKKAHGAELNQIKNQITQAIDSKKQLLENLILEKKLFEEKIDITLPPRPYIKGNIHPISFVIEEVTNIFAELGFSVAKGPDIEDDFHNFTALNIPDNHPARQMHDSFYFDNNMLLRTHTSSVQIREMREKEPPHYFIVPGRTYRCDSDMTHTPMFHQIEGVAIDKNLTMAHLKGTIESFLKTFFGIDDLPIRFRPSFFPFTEPSAEVDIGYLRKDNEIIIGKGDSWLEILGCGMVHPEVLKNVGIDPNIYQGFAFGAGIERLAMLKYGIPDLRTFFESDVRWLENYGFSSLESPNLTWSKVK